mmetsp:Transcript_14865/g.35261  ORF Transcript_14865/g.35261 Transcript_14865/m.35261 type:complete len:225 (-) Transcript_14865:1043-1717(-)
MGFWVSMMFWSALILSWMVDARSSQASSAAKRAMHPRAVRRSSRTDLSSWSSSSCVQSSTSCAASRRHFSRKVRKSFAVYRPTDCRSVTSTLGPWSARVRLLHISNKWSSASCVEMSSLRSRCMSMHVKLQMRSRLSGAEAERRKTPALKLVTSRSRINDTSTNSCSCCSVPTSWRTERRECWKYAWRAASSGKTSPLIAARSTKHCLRACPSIWWCRQTAKHE